MTMKERTPSQRGNITITIIRLRCFPSPKTLSSLVCLLKRLRARYANRYRLRGDAANVKATTLWYFVRLCRAIAIIAATMSE